MQTHAPSYSSYDAPPPELEHGIPYAEHFEPVGDDPLAAVPDEPAPDEEPPFDRLDGTGETLRLEPEDVDRLRYDVQAAHRFLATGLPERAVEQYLGALRRFAVQGDSRRALLVANQALALLERQSTTNARDAMRIRVLLSAARVQWRGVGRGPEFTLQRALETLGQARKLLGENTPLELRVELAQVMAGICHDLGDLGSLRRALDILTETAQALRDAGQARWAIYLLNDRAEIYLRAGDAARAARLLQKSHQVLEGMRGWCPDEPRVIEAWARTEHLLARLPLGARLREGHEEDALFEALEHAMAAAEAYGRLEDRVSFGRVQQTMGRLQTARSQYTRAAAHLEIALQISRQFGDVTGLAQGAAALADLHVATGRPAEAMGALEESVATNAEKGSPQGLAVNRHTIEHIMQTLEHDPHPSPDLCRSVQAIDEWLGRAEASLGSVSLPA